MKQCKSSRFWFFPGMCSTSTRLHSIANYICILHTIWSCVHDLERLEVGAFWRLNQLSIMWGCHFFFQLCKYILHGVLSLPICKKSKFLWLNLLEVKQQVTKHNQHRRENRYQLKKKSSRHNVGELAAIRAKILKTLVSCTILYITFIFLSFFQTSTLVQSKVLRDSEIPLQFHG